MSKHDQYKHIGLWGPLVEQLFLNQTMRVCVCVSEKEFLKR